MAWRPHKPAVDDYIKSESPSTYSPPPPSSSYSSSSLSTGIPSYIAKKKDSPNKTVAMNVFKFKKITYDLGRGCEPCNKALVECVRSGTSSRCARCAAQGYNSRKCGVRNLPLPNEEETAAHKRKRGPDTPESLYTPSASTRHVRVASSRGTNPKTLGTNVNMAIAMVLNDFDNADADYGWTYRYTVLYDNSMLTIPSNREIAKAAAGTGDIPIEVVFGRTLIELREGLASNYETGEDNLPQVDSTEGVPPPYESVLEVGKFEEEEVEEDEADVVSPAQSAFKEHEAVKEGIRASINAVFEENMDYFLSQVSAKKASRNERARRGVS
ncbi:MAG: hypothetical protein GOMPHAMPRED_002975 [Gomphillus americanus]|uniref:Uncharacterized protein n=1 Tax=Gomphillus americanus TaxID=1940652 RepID=A0A8H3I4Y5_9LECA|nr:MAG: hypothetical protein GOMPHAMPRED_002975 [Gomphillus americanus]